MTPLDDDVLHDVLDRMPVARLAVIRPDGRPEAMPIVFARVGGTLFSPVDGKPKRHARLARLAAIERCPAVGLLLDHYAPDWSRLWWLKLGGEAVIAEGVHPEWEPAVAALRAKYPQYRETPLFKGRPVMVCLSWDTVRWWAAGGLAGVRQWLAEARQAAS